MGNTSFNFLLQTNMYVTKKNMYFALNYYVNNAFDLGPIESIALTVINFIITSSAYTRL